MSKKGNCKENEGLLAALTRHCVLWLLLAERLLSPAIKELLKIPHWQEATTISCGLSNRQPIESNWISWVKGKDATEVGNGETSDWVQRVAIFSRTLVHQEYIDSKNNNIKTARNCQVIWLLHACMMSTYVPGKDDRTRTTYYTQTPDQWSWCSSKLARN